MARQFGRYDFRRIAALLIDASWSQSATVALIGWALNNRMKHDLAIRAFRMTVAFHAPPIGCVYHMDRGHHCCSHDYQKRLRQHAFKVSMCEKTDCYNNCRRRDLLQTELI